MLYLYGVNWAKRILLVVALGVAGWFLWTTFFPSHERVIQKRCRELQAAVSFGPNEGELAKVNNAGRVVSFFTRDADIMIDVPGFQRQTLSGRDQLFQVATAARTRMPGLKAEFVDIIPKVDPGGKTATVGLTAKASIPGERDFMVQELEFQMRREGRTWLIRKVLTVRTLN